MRYIKNVALVLLLCCSMDTFSQSGEYVPMADVLRQDGKIYTVVFAILIILTAMIVLLIRVDRKLFRLERDLKQNNKS